MRSFFPAFVVALLLALPAAAGEDGLSGFWKFSFFQGGNQTTAWLFRLDSKDGKLTATAAPLREAPPAKIEEVKQTGDTFQIKFKATFDKEIISFLYEGKLPKPGAKKILGSLSAGTATFPAVMEATSAKNSFEVEREILQRTPSDPKALSAILEIIETAQANKLDAKDLQELVDGSLKSGELFGPRYQLTHNLRLLKALSVEKTYAAVTLETARKIAKQIDPKSPAAAQLQALTSVVNILRAGNEKGEVKALETRIDDLENLAYAEYSKDALNFKTDKFPGRKGKSKRAVLVELFTGAMCGPCLAADMSFDGLEKAYSAKEVVLLQYHMHIPRPEPMANVDSDTRFEYYVDNYRKQVRGTPSILFNGKPDAPQGGFREDAPEKYKEYCEVVNKLLESPTTVQLAASAVRTGDKIDITAKVTGLDKLDDKLRLRLALVEDWVRFKGSNTLQYHHRVVRALPGGIKGFALKQKESEHQATVELDELRRKLNKYLDEDYAGDGPRPLRLRNLHVVAFVQNDDTTEILQAIDVVVKDEK
jgi:hypothetical protein